MIASSEDNKQLNFCEPRVAWCVIRNQKLTESESHKAIDADLESIHCLFRICFDRTEAGTWFDFIIVKVYKTSL